MIAPRYILCMGKKIDYTGQKFSRLTFVKPTAELKRRAVVWKLLCDCGNQCQSIAIDVKRGKKQSCGCLHKESAAKNGRAKRDTGTDYTGKKFGYLTFIERTGKRSKDNKGIWKVKCDCGNFIERKAFDLVAGRSKSCGCMKVAMIIEIRDKNSRAMKGRKHHPKESSRLTIWRDCYSDCPYETYCELSQKNCHYCGGVPSRKYNVANTAGNSYNSAFQREEGAYICNGLDRVDNTRGHDSDNVVPCCWNCNKMKSNMPVGEFLYHIQRIADHNEAMRKLACESEEPLQLELNLAPLPE